MENVQILIHDNDKIEIGKPVEFDYKINCFTINSFKDVDYFNCNNLNLNISKETLNSIEFKVIIAGDVNGEIKITLNKKEIIYKVANGQLSLDSNKSEGAAKFELIQTYNESIDKYSNKTSIYNLDIENIFNEHGFNINITFDSKTGLIGLVDKSININRTSLDYILINKLLQNQKLKSEAATIFDFENSADNESNLIIPPTTSKYSDFTLTWKGVPKYKNDLFGNAVEFTGSNFIAANREFNADNLPVPKSFSFWFKLKDYDRGNWGALFGLNAKSTYDNNYQSFFIDTSCQLRFIYRGIFEKQDRNETIPFSKQIDLNKWYNLYFYFNNGIFYIYLNGELLFNNTLKGVKNFTTWYLLAGYKILGTIDNIMLFDKILNEDEIKVLSNPFIDICNPTTKYKLDVKDLNIFYEDSAANNANADKLNFTNLKLNNVYSYFPFDINTLDIINNIKVNSIGIEEYEPGKIWNSLKFENNYLNITSTENSEKFKSFINNFHNHFTTWINIKDTTTLQSIFTSYKNDKEIFKLEIENNKLNLKGRNDLNSDLTDIFSSDIKKGWQLLTISKINDSTYYIYINAKKIGAFNFNFIEADELYIGADKGTSSTTTTTTTTTTTNKNYFNGDLDEFKIYSGNINILENIKLYNAIENVPYIKNIIKELNDCCSFPCQLGNFKLDLEVDGNTSLAVEYEDPTQSKIFNTSVVNNKIYFNAPGLLNKPLTVGNFSGKQLGINMSVLDCILQTEKNNFMIPVSYNFNKPMIKFGFNINSVVESLIYEIYKNNLPVSFLYLGKENLNENVLGYISLDNDVNFNSIKYDDILSISTNSYFEQYSDIRAYLKGNVQNSKTTTELEDFSINFNQEKINSDYSNYNLIIPILRNSKFNTILKINETEEDIDFDTAAIIKLEFADNQIKVYVRNITNNIKVSTQWNLIDSIDNTKKDAINITLLTKGNHSDYNKYFGVYLLKDEVEKIITKIMLMIQSDLMNCMEYWGNLKVTKISVF